MIHSSPHTPLRLTVLEHTLIDQAGLNSDLPTSVSQVLGFKVYHTQAKHSLTDQHNNKQFYQSIFPLQPSKGCGSQPPTTQSGWNKKGNKIRVPIVEHSVILVLRKLRQADCHENKALYFKKMK